jgi:hypothetical protein
MIATNAAARATTMTPAQIQTRAGTANPPLRRSPLQKYNQEAFDGTPARGLSRGRYPSPGVGATAVARNG